MSESTEFEGPRSLWRERVKRGLLKAFHAALVGGSLHAEYLLKLGFAEEGIFKGYDAVDNSHFYFGAQRAREREKAFAESLIFLKISS